MDSQELENARWYVRHQASLVVVAIVLQQGNLAEDPELLRSEAKTRGRAIDDVLPRLVNSPFAKPAEDLRALLWFTVGKAGPAPSYEQLTAWLLEIERLSEAVCSTGSEVE